MAENFIREAVGFAFIALALWAMHYAVDYQMKRMGTLKGTKFYGNFLIGLSLLLLFITAFQFYNDVRYYFSGQQATALVIEGFPENKLRYIYSFQIDSGETIQGDGDYLKNCLQSIECSPHKDDKITIEYLPDSPTSNRILHTYFSPMMLLPFLLLFWGRKYRNKQIAN